MMPAWPRFFALLLSALLACCAGYAAAVLYSTELAGIRAVYHIFPFNNWHLSASTTALLPMVRQGLAAGSLLLAGLFGALAWPAAGRRDVVGLRLEISAATTGLLRGWRELRNRQKGLATALLTLLTIVRVYFSFANPEYDDAVSYELFVSKGLVATSAYYPLPNNHVLSNTVSMLFYQVSPGFWWSMRLPVLLQSTAATVLLFVGLVRRTRFRVALVAVGLFCGLQLSLYHAGVGRGYWLFILLAVVGFFSTLELGRPGGRHRAAWLGLVLAGVLGTYTVPPFLYVLASAYSWLGLRLLRRRAWAEAGPLVVAGLGTVAGTALLYAPLMLISGGKALVATNNVGPMGLDAFWAGLPGYLWHTEGFLAGQRTLGALLTLPVLALLAWLWRHHQTNQPDEDRAHELRQVGGPALWFMLLPYAVILVQRVFPPERVMLYKAAFFFLLTGLVVDWALARWSAKELPWLRPALVALAVLFGTYETYSVVRVNPVARSNDAAYRAGLHWLAAQPPGAVLAPEVTHNLFLRFYAHTEVRERAWHIDHDQRPGIRYAYVVAFPGKRGFFQPLFPFPPAFQNAELEIYRVPATYPLDSKSWRHN
ncbi:hypothetical protein [Hymenobacter ruricola]|uniref:Glycosyltransferase RgtA/B/C/D-like domain-containing protein n=1 Tax=Hymenobacter ruricola TaxID=2791023 RepID=A0ABS0I086_9BACT|nr:hypothetical protein [Hymenobacter ruricola]MBF9220350.1 hypothetical protein [Hymenobacter ruricola]